MGKQSRLKRERRDMRATGLKPDVDLKREARRLAEERQREIIQQRKEQEEAAYQEYKQKRLAELDPENNDVYIDDKLCRYEYAETLEIRARSSIAPLIGLLSALGSIAMQNQIGEMHNRLELARMENDLRHR